VQGGGGAAGGRGEGGGRAGDELVSTPSIVSNPGNGPAGHPNRSASSKATTSPDWLEHVGEHRSIFEWLADTGVRINEALGLRWCDIDLDAALLHVRQQLGA
jgi:hypothetical protein